MTDKKISELTQATFASTQQFLALDSTRTVGDQNVRVPASSFPSGSGGSPASGITSLTTDPILVPPGLDDNFMPINADSAFTDAMLIEAPQAGLDLVAIALTLTSVGIRPPQYNIRLYAGDPANGGRFLTDYYESSLTFIGADGTFVFNFPHLIAVAGGNLSVQTSLWIRIQSNWFVEASIVAQTTAAYFVSDGRTVPTYQAPPAYTGPLLDTVHVGPTRDFVEPRYGLQALADGGTMIVDPGMYFLPFGITGDPTAISITDTRYGPNPNDPNGAARFVQGITIRGSGTYGPTPTIFNGMGGLGLQEGTPFRLIRGQGFVWTNSPLTIEDIRFIRCGGEDQNSDGEAAIYCSNFPNESLVHVLRCAFDWNENGIFTQYWHGDGADESNLSNATGNCRLLTITIENCDFGYWLPNGGGGDGGSHDFYINCAQLNVINSHFYGGMSPWPPPMRQGNTVISGYNGVLNNPPTSGNDLKSRAYTVNIDGCFIQVGTGKMIDRPEGGFTTINNTVFVGLPSSNSLQIGYNTEGTHPSTPMSDMVFTNCSVYLGRNLAIFWNATPFAKFDFSDPGNHIYFATSNVRLSPTRLGGSLAYDPSAFAGMESEWIVDPHSYFGIMTSNPDPGATVALPTPPGPASYSGTDVAFGPTPR